MIKRFLVSFFALFSLATFAQQGTASPYSFYGIGEAKFKGLAENRLMGGVAVFPDSIHINLQNPASYSSLKLTTFTVGGTQSLSNFSSYEGSEKTRRTALDYLVVGSPVGKKMGIAFGLIPYTSVGYKVRTEDFITGTIRRYNGEGGMNKAFLGAGYKFNNNFSVGLDVAYNFGQIEATSIRYISGIQFGSEEFNSSDLSGFSFNIGAMYNRKIGSKYKVFGSLAYSPESDLKLRNQRYYGLIDYVEDYTPGVVQLLEPELSSVTVKMPSRLTIGAGFGQERKWLVGTEVTLQQSNNLGNRYNEITNATFENSIKYSFGGYWIPNYASFTNYFSKVTYRAGFRYENTGLVINNEKIKDYAFTGGFGFPLGGTFSNLNLGVEYGRKGTGKANLVEENYTNIVLSFSLNDQWFIKRRYD